MTRRDALLAQILKNLNSPFDEEAADRREAHFANVSDKRRPLPLPTLDDEGNEVEPLKAGEWNEEEHPREPSGSPAGGQFAPKGSTSVSNGGSSSARGETPKGRHLRDEIAGPLADPESGKWVQEWGPAPSEPPVMKPSRGVIAPRPEAQVMSKPQRDHLRTFEEETIAAPAEFSIIIDAEGHDYETMEANIVLGRRGDRKTVEWSQEDIAKIRQLAPTRDLICTHNHPGGNGFSISDIGFAAQKNLAEIRVTTQDVWGRRWLYRLRRPDGGWPRLGAIWARGTFMGDAEATRARVWKEMVRDKVNPWHASAEWPHVWVSRLAKKYRMPYSRERLNAPLKAGEWDESKHPRHPAGTSAGGEFAPAGGGQADGAPSTNEEMRARIDRLHTAGEQGKKVLETFPASVRKYLTENDAGWLRKQLNSARFETTQTPDGMTIADLSRERPDYVERARAVSDELMRQHGVPVVFTGFKDRAPGENAWSEMAVNDYVARLPAGIREELRAAGWTIMVGDNFEPRIFKVGEIEFIEGGHANSQTKVVMVRNASRVQEILLHELGHVGTVALGARLTSAGDEVTDTNLRMTLDDVVQLNRKVAAFAAATREEGGVTHYARSYQQGAILGAHRRLIARNGRPFTMEAAADENFAEITSMALHGYAPLDAESDHGPYWGGGLALGVLGTRFPKTVKAYTELLAVLLEKK